MPQGRVRRTEPRTIAPTKPIYMQNREFWTTKEGVDMYPHEFDDTHLVNTIRMLNRKVEEMRVEHGVAACKLFQHRQHAGVDTSVFYNHFRRDVEPFIDRSQSNEDWMKEKSKIYCLLIEEAKYRGLDLSEPTEKRKKSQQFVYRTNSSTSDRARYVPNLNTQSFAF